MARRQEAHQLRLSVYARYQFIRNALLVLLALSPYFTAFTYIFLSKCVPVDNSDIFFARIGDDEFGIIYIARAPQLWRKRQRCRGGNRVGDRLCRGSHGRYSCSLCRRSGSHRRCCPFNIKKTRDHHENNEEKRIMCKHAVYTSRLALRP